MSAENKILPVEGKKYQLITRSDMDGLVCAVLLKKIGVIDEVKFVHPKDMQDNLIEVTENDISTNLPYVDGVFLCFDHHDSEATRAGNLKDNHIMEATAKSAARVVYDYFGGKDAFPDITDEMMDAVDKADSAGFTRQDIIDPHGWELLSFLMDSRTGLGRFRDFNISCSVVHKHIVVLDLRNEETIWAGNRFMIYALFPQCNVSIHVLWGRNKQNTVLAVGKSILNKTSETHIGNLMLENGGGGHNGTNI